MNLSNSKRSKQNHPIELDDFRKDNVLKTLSYAHMYFLEKPEMSNNLIHANRKEQKAIKTSGTPIHLAKIFQVKKPKKSSVYYVKPAGEVKYDVATKGTFMEGGLQSILSSVLYNMLNVNQSYVVPKEKLILQRPRKPDLLYTASKSVEMNEVKVVNQKFSPDSKMQDPKSLSDYVINNSQIENQDYRNKSEGYCRLMAATLLIGEVDMNMLNFFIEKGTKKIGKFDHDRTLSKNGMGFDESAHIFQIRRFFKAEQNIRQKVKGFFKSDVRDSVAKHLDGYFLENPSKGASLDEFYKHLDSNPAKKFMFVEYLKCVDDYLRMPKELVDYIFSTKLLTTKDEIPQNLKKDIEIMFKECRIAFDNNRNEIRELFADHLERLHNGSLDSEYSKTKPIDYSCTLKALKLAKEKKINLHEMKLELKNRIINAVKRVNGSKKQDIQKTHEPS